jgi:hypothetical protein
MTWEDINKAYDASFAHLMPLSKKNAETGFAELVEAVKNRFPAAIDDPFLLVKTDWRQVLETLRYNRKVPAESISDNCVKALIRVKKLLNQMDAISDWGEGMSADRDSFTKNKVLFCFRYWLEKNKWTIINDTYYSFITGDLTAEKEKQALFACALSSVTVWSETDATRENHHAFKTSLSVVLFKLMDAMNKDKNVVAAILIPDDKNSRAYITEYKSYLLKTGIKIYMIKSPLEVSELEN